MLRLQERMLSFVCSKADSLIGTRIPVKQKPKGQQELNQEKASSVLY